MNALKGSELNPEAVDYFTSMFDPLKGISLSL